MPTHEARVWDRGSKSNSALTLVEVCFHGTILATPVRPCHHADAGVRLRVLPYPISSHCGLADRITMAIEKGSTCCSWWRGTWRSPLAKHNSRRIVRWRRLGVESARQRRSGVLRAPLDHRREAVPEANATRFGDSTRQDHQGTVGPAGVIASFDPAVTALRPCPRSAPECGFDLVSASNGSNCCSPLPPLAGPRSHRHSVHGQSRRWRQHPRLSSSARPWAALLSGDELDLVPHAALRGIRQTLPRQATLSSSHTITIGRPRTAASARSGIRSANPIVAISLSPWRGSIH